MRNCFILKFCTAKVYAPQNRFHKMRQEGKMLRRKQIFPQDAVRCSDKSRICRKKNGNAD